MTFKENQEVYSTKYWWIGRVIGQTGNKVSVSVSSELPTQEWKASDVHEWDWAQAQKTIFGE
jgi:hypothetical protein